MKIVVFNPITEQEMTAETYRKMQAFPNCQKCREPEKKWRSETRDRIALVDAGS